MKATIKDVANYAGVSFKTVSRVINHEGTVRPDTLEKVNKAIEELKYQPNKAARNLAGSHSYALGFIYDNPNAYYIIDMQKGILEECSRKGYELLIHPCDSSDPTTISQIKEMAKRTQLSGLIVSPPLSENPDFVRELQNIDLQFVRLVSGPLEQDESSACVFVNDRKAAQSVVEYLISLGHEKIAFISGERDHKSTLERYAGYCQAMQAHQLDIKDEWYIEGRYSFDSGLQGAQSLLQLQDRPSAIFACNDEIAAGAMLASKLAGIDVPNQLSIAGFEDSPFAKQTIPKLTTAAQKTQNIASSAAELLINKINQRKLALTSHPLKHQHHTPELVIRGSTALNKP